MLDNFQIRRLGKTDSLEDLTSMLHRAFSPMGRAGIGCTCFNQSVETTAHRVRLGECFVAMLGDRMVGTLTLHEPQRRSECRWYRHAKVASLHQFAVDPLSQGTGCGALLLDFAKHWAVTHGFMELALDTPTPAAHLIRYYEAQGFRQVELAQLPGKSYVSCILSQTVGTPVCSPAPALPAHRNLPRQALLGTLVL